MGDRLNGKVAVVTGAGRGIGRHIALFLAGEGAKVVVNDLPKGVKPSRHADIAGGDADATAREITDSGKEAIAFSCSVADFDATRDLMQAAVEHFGGMHILVNNAGILSLGMPWEISEEEWDEGCATCLKGSWNCIRHASVLMKEQGWGRIINCSSISALGTAAASVYGSAKAGILGLTSCVAWDLRPYGITCNAFLPQARQSVPEREEQDQTLFRNRLALGQITEVEYERLRNRPNPEAVAPFVAYLATEEASDISGQLFFVRGGVVAVYPQPEPLKQITKIEDGREGVWTLDELIERAPELRLNQAHT